MRFDSRHVRIKYGLKDILAGDLQNAPLLLLISVAKGVRDFLVRFALEFQDQIVVFDPPSP